MLSEQQVTTIVMNYLSSNGWEIITFDYPQSGTGFVLHPNNSDSKNKGAIIPDIIARRNNIGVVFENKDRFFLDDFKKVERLRTTDVYNQGLNRLFRREKPQIMFYGIAIPHVPQDIDKASRYFEMVDFLMTVKKSGQIEIIYSCEGYPLL